MKLNRRNPLFRAVNLSVMAIIFSQSLQAASGTWNVNANGDWGTATNWATSTIADGSGSTANFVFNITADRTVTLNSSRTLTTLTFTDATTASHNWILNNSNSAILTLAGTAPGFNVTNQTATISAPIDGTTALTKTGAGTLVLSGANTFNAGITTVSGPLQLNNNSAAGTGAIAVSTITGASANRLLINGGVTITNAVSVAPHAGTAGFGSLQQTGTGQGRINGPITITGGPSAGGNFVGGGAVGSELVLGGAINSTLTGLSQREGRVVYAGGGSGGSWNNLTVTGTALIGATNGIPTGVSIQLGGSGSATLDLNGYDQTLSAATLGNGGNNFVGTINLGAKTLTLNGNITSVTPTTQTTTHFINATAGSGTLDIGATTRTITLPDSLALDDLLITGATISGSGGVTKDGAGALTLKNVTVAGPLTINAGTLATGRYTEPAAVSATTGSLAFADATALRMKAGPGGDLITTGTLTTAGTTTVTLSQAGGLIPNGTYPLINYTGTSPGLTGFTLSPLGHSVSSLIDTGTAIALQVTGNDSVIWDGTNSDNWVGAEGNWKRSSNSAATDYIESDAVIFNDLPVSSNVNIASNVAPSSVTFNNTLATPYSVIGTGGIIGTTGLTKTANGLLSINNPNAYTGATTISSGSVVANFSAGTAIPTASAINVALGASLALNHNGGTIALNNPTLTGAGTVTIDPNLTTAGNRDLGGVNWDASAFTGPLVLSSTTGTMRIQANTPVDVGTGPITVTTGGQLYINTANLIFPNNFTITGTGYGEGTGTLGAIRATGTTTLTGTISVSGSAKIGALGGTAIVTNTLSGGDLTFGGSINNTGGETLAITGDASGLTSLTVNDGSATSAATSIAVNVGNNTATGTIGAVPVSLLADGFKNSVIRFDRTDGYTLGNTITATSTVAANHIRTFVDADSQGTGFSDGGFAINLGGNLSTTGGQFRVGTNRVNSIANLTGSLTVGSFLVGAGQGFATANLNSGAVANVGTARVASGASAANTTSVLNFNNNSAFNAFSLGLGEVSGGIATVNQATGSTVNVESQLRVSHYGNNTSFYNMAGGTLTMTGASPNLTPSTVGAGGNNAAGDNNINALPTQALVGGGIYLGNDGTGILNHTGGTVTTNWIVLDNRGASGAGVNMPDGIDRYNLSGATSVLNLRSTWGIIGRNDGSYDVSLGGGTIKVDNTGTDGTIVTTGPNITVPIDAILSTVASTTTTLDTNAAVNTGNAFTLSKNVNGTGTLALTGGGKVNLSTAGIQNIAANLSSSGTTANLDKLGTGTTTLAGNMSGFTGNVTVSEGRLNVPASLNTPVTVGALGTLSGEISLPSLTLNGGTVLFDPNSAGTLAVTNLVINSNSLLDVSAAPGVGTFTALTYTGKSGAGTLAVANASNYRTAPVVTDNGVSSVSVTFAAGKSLTWTGTTNSDWKIAGDPLTESNWTDGAIGVVFYSGDSVTFPTGVATTGITLTGLLAPAGVSVTSDDTTNYTFTSSAGNQITGTTGLTKSNTSTLTLVGPNAYSGITSISGGTISIAADSLGSGVAGNSLALSGGGKLSYTGTVAADLGINRNIAVGTGGGVLEHNSATAATITIPGSLSGSDALAFQSVAAGGATVSLSGSNAAYTGAIAVNSIGTGLTTLRIDNAAAAPGGGSITLNYPAAGAGGNTTTLALLPGTTLPAATTVNLTSAQTTVSLRSRIATSGNVTIGSPITAAGNTIVEVFANAGSTATLNGAITETAPGSFFESTAGNYSNVLFLRGSTAGTIIVNGQINLPSAGSTIAVTDGPTAIINSTGNVFNSANAVYGTLRIGATNAIPTTARLVIGQAGNQACTFDLNGFDQTVTGLEWQAPTGNLLTKGISNSHPTNVSTFTVNQATAPLASFNGTISGNTNLVKEGAETTTLLAPASNFTGNVTVNNGTLVASGNAAAAGANGPLGAVNVVGKTVTVGATGTLSFITNNIFGNGVANANLPAVIVNGGTLTSTRYNVLGNVTLNGGTLTQAATDGPGGYEGYQFQGNITVGGSAVSTISTTNSRANHLGTSTQFEVADAVGGADLVVSAGLKNLSTDFGGTAGSLTKNGVGTMVLNGVNTYTGNTTVNAGTLELADNAQLRFTLGATSGTNNSLSGAGTVIVDGDFAIDTTAADALTAGTWVLESATSLPGAYGTNFQVVNTDGSPWTNTGETWTKTGAGGRTWTFDEMTGTLALSMGGYSSWASANAGGQDPDLDFDLDGVENGVEFFMGQTGSTFTANPALVGNTITWPKSALFIGSGTYRVETSPDLVIWTDVTGTAVDNGSSVVYTLPTGSPKLFVHLVVIPN